MSRLKSNNEVVLFNDAASRKVIQEHSNKREPLVMVKKYNQNQKTLPASEASRMLLHTQGKRPFDLIPDELIIEEKRIIIKRHYFPFVTTISTIPMSKLTNFEVTHSIFYSSVHIKANLIMDTTVQWLSHSDAQEAKELIDGIRIRDNDSIVVMEQDRRRFIQTLELIGQT